MGGGGAEERSASEAHAVDKAGRIPGSLKQFTVDAADAARLHGIGSELQQRLLDLGLAHRGSGAERRFDRLDLDNIGIDLRLPCPRWTAMRWWSRSLPARVVPGPSEYDLVLRTECPTPELEHACEVVFHPGTVKSGEPADVSRRPLEEYRIELTTQWTDHCFGEAFSALIAEILPVEFHLMPEPLVSDPGFVAAAGLADCRMATAFLTRAAARLGVPARPVAGLFLARPFALRHWWIELLDDGAWIAADPFLLNTFQRWGITQSAHWPANRSPSGVLWQLAVPATPIASHGGVPMKNVNVLSSPRPARIQTEQPEAITS